MFLVLLQVTNASASDDFLGLSNSVTFSDGQTESTGVLIIRNDAIPELNETFLIQIIDARFGAEIGSVSSMLLTVRASDDPNGKLQFDPVRTLYNTCTRLLCMNHCNNSLFDLTNSLSICCKQCIMRY